MEIELERDNSENKERWQEAVVKENGDLNSGSNSKDGGGEKGGSTYF